MKKLIGLVLAALLLLALAAPALAEPTYNPATGRITDSYTGDGNAEYWVDGAPAGAGKLNIIAEAGSTHTVSLFVNGKPAGTWTVYAGAAEAPTAAPTEAATNAPADAPTEAPSATATVTPTDAATTVPTAAPTAVVTASPTKAATSGSSSSDIPKTGDGALSFTVIAVIMGIAALTLIASRFVRTR